MNLATKAMLINDEMHGVELDLDIVAGQSQDDLRIVKDYGIVVLMGKCPCKYNAHQVDGPCFWLNPCVIKRRGGKLEGTVDVLVHDGTYCLPENQGKWSCNRGRAMGEAASQHLRVVKAAVAMYDGSGGGIGDLKRAARGLIKLRGLQTGRRTGRHLTAQELAIVRLVFPSLHGILGEEHLKEALGALESQGRNWAEELEL